MAVLARLFSLALTLFSIHSPSEAGYSEQMSPPNRRMKNLVTFGDSFTDVVNVWNGGVQWPRYAAGYANATLASFARAGATCSNKITWSKPTKSLFEIQLPRYIQQVQHGTLDLHPEETLYTLWLGTNDVGPNSLLTGSNDASIVDVSACMLKWVETMYELGARHFLFQNMVPLQHIPMYRDGAYLTKFWSDPRNSTAWNVFITELVLSGNALTKFGLQTLASSLPEARIGLFDSYALFMDMLDKPQLYLNGTSPLNITGCANSCVYQEHGLGGAHCTTINGTDRDSFLWWDELHPSEQADRVVAGEVALVMQGKGSKWNTWL